MKKIVMIFREGGGRYLIRTMPVNQYYRNNEMEKSQFYIHQCNN